MRFRSARLLAALTGMLLGASAGAASPGAFVDDQGVLRWSDTHAEVAQFGVNYTAPFAYAFRAHQRLGVPLERAIDADTYHFARLGLDAYRVHLWDREISDPDGNLLTNDHLRAFDYLLAQLERRGIKIILTPLQFGNAGYPEPGVPLPGFSSRYGKQGCLEDRTSWPLQARYLAQLISHQNPITGIAYRDDPNIIGIEICNEPGHFDYAPTLAYINTMVAAIRGAGSAQPIFYNMSHGIPVHQAYLDADVQGGTFQWYPSNLLAGHEQRGNFLPYVDDYPIPFANDPRFQKKAKIVYEFDAADIGRAYLYPAMARTFRKIGVQFATQFAYDPLYLAPFNTEYQTHYLNLAYAPQKALGLKIAAEAFRRISRHQDFGAYPTNTSFAGVRLSYDEDLAEFVTDREFFYSNSTATRPPQPASLEQIAGYGDSPVVSYPGRGAYFLDRLEAGVWRLEVMPDALWVRDPFEAPSPAKQVARIAWNHWPLTLRLPDLGTEFTATGLNDGNTFAATAADGRITIGPGSYLLTRRGVTSRWSADSRWHNFILKEFVAPPPSLDRTYVLHTPAVEASAASDLTVTATVAGPEAPTSVELVAYLPANPADVFRRAPVDPRAQPGGGNTPGPGSTETGAAQSFRLRPTGGLTYTTTIPGARLHPGTLDYHVVVHHAGEVVTYPSQLSVPPTDWSFYGRPWRTRLVAAGAPLLLFDAAADVSAVTADHRDIVYPLVPSDRPGTSALAMIARDLDQPGHDYSWRFFFRDRIQPRVDRLASARQFVVYGRSLTDRPCKVQLALVTADGFAYGALVEFTPQADTRVVALAALRPVASPNIPHGYPVFIPFWSPPATDTPLDVRRAESLLVSIGPGLAPADYDSIHAVAIERAWLE